MYYCSINLKMQSEHSGLRPDTSSLVESFATVCWLCLVFCSLIKRALIITVFFSDFFNFWQKMPFIKDSLDSKSFGIFSRSSKVLNCLKLIQSFLWLL